MMAGVKQEADASVNMMADVLSTAGSGSDVQTGLVDNIDSLLDLSEFDNANNNPYNSPSLSPVTANKDSLVRPAVASTPASMLSTSQPMSGPSHQYDQYKQQTGFVPGALADAFAITQNTSQMTAYNSGIPGTGMDMAFLGMAGGADSMFDFNTAPNGSHANTNNNTASTSMTSPSDGDLEFESPAADSAFFFPEQMANGSGLMPTANGARSLSHGMPSPSPAATSQDHVGRLWPGMHQQAALVKAQAQQRQQQQIIQQQRQQSAGAPTAAAAAAAAATARVKSSQSTDPIVQHKISQLFNAMRANGESGLDGNGGSMHMTRSKKDEEDMDEDERLLASEEGKKLTSKERRQLRNKVSARAFRSRRKEYITQLEAEIATKVNENSDLRTQNRALLEENKRLSDLTRMLLGSPSFSDFLDRLSANPALQPQNAAPQPKPAAQPEQRPERQAPKDVNAYAAQQQIGMAILPEHSIDFTMLQSEVEPAFTFQPQVYAVLHTPDMAAPAMDASILSGKTSNFVGSCHDEEEKIEMPVLAHPVAPAESEEDTYEKTDKAVEAAVVDEAFESDPAFALYHDAPLSAAVVPADVEEAAPLRCTPTGLNTAGFSEVDLFGGIDTGKALARYQLVDASEEVVREVNESLAVARIARLTSSMAATLARLDMMNVGS